MSELTGQLSLFGEDFEYMKTCEDCGRVWSSYSPFPENWECPACKSDRERIENT